MKNLLLSEYYLKEIIIVSAYIKIIIISNNNYILITIIWILYLYTSLSQTLSFKRLDIQDLREESW